MPSSVQLNPYSIDADDGADEAARLRAQLATRRTQARKRAQELRKEVKSTFDWREQVRRHPLACTVAALAIGYLGVPANKPTVKLDDEQLQRLFKHGKLKVNVDGAVKENTGAISGFLLAAGGFALRAAVNRLLNQQSFSSEHYDGQLSRSESHQGYRGKSMN